jgi:hypothetical protein
LEYSTGRRIPAARIAEALRPHDADIVVLSEYRGGPSAPGFVQPCMRSAIDTRQGLFHRPAATVCSSPPGTFRRHGAVEMGLPQPYRMVSVDFDMFRLIGIYMPNLLAKIPYWEALIGVLSGRSANHTLAICEFNTCRAYLDEAGAIDPKAQHMDAMEQIGFRDLWRHRYPD